MVKWLPWGLKHFFAKKFQNSFGKNETNIERMVSLRALKKFEALWVDVMLYSI